MAAKSNNSEFTPLFSESPADSCKIPVKLHKNRIVNLIKESIEKPTLKELWKQSEELHLRFGTEFSLGDVSAARKAESEAADEAITQQLERISSTHQEVARQILELNQTIQDEVFMELE